MEGFHMGDDTRPGRAESLRPVPEVQGLSAKPAPAASGWRSPAVVGVVSGAIG